MKLTWEKFLEEKGLTKATFAEKEANEAAELYNEFNAKKEEELAQAIEAKASKEDLQELKNEIFEHQSNQLKALNQALKNQGVQIQKMLKVEKDANIPVDQQIKSALKEHTEALKVLKDRKGESVVFEISYKAMTITGNVTGEVPPAMVEPGMNRIQDRSPFVRNWILSGTTNSDLVRWVEQQNRTGSTGGTSEEAVKNEIAFDLVAVDASVKKRTNFIKVSTEMLEDIDFIDSEIRNELLILLNLDVDDQQLNGDDTGNNLNGLITIADTFAAGNLAASIDEANNYDVLRAAIKQIALSNFMPTFIFMNPEDTAEMDLTKGTDGHYVLPPFVSADGTRVKAIPIIENNGVAADNFLVGDGTKATIFDRKTISIEIGLDADDFTKNLRTIIAEWRGVQRVKGNDTSAFVTGDFTTAKAALETP